MKFNRPSILTALLVVSLLPAQVFAAKGGKPPPEPVPAGDVVCDDSGGCVDASDIVDGAVTTEKLSPQLQQQINDNSAKADRTADLCRLYSLLHERALIGDLNIPSYCTVDSKDPKVVFLTEHIYTPDLGGLAGADSTCQMLAANAGLQGVYKAWLSDSTISAAQRMTHNKGPYVRTDGVVVAHDWDDLVDGDLMASISVGVYPSQPVIQGLVFTGTRTNGSAWATNERNSDYCGDWTGSITGHFSQGTSSNTDNGWTGGAGWICDPSGWEGSLYCIQQ